MTQTLRSSIKGALNHSIKPGLLKPAQFRGSTLDLDFAGAKSLKNQIGKKDVVSFTRASSGTYVGADGLIKTTPVNLLTYSEQFENAAWNKINGLSIDSTLVTGPDGTLSGRRLLGFDTAAGERLTEVITITNSTLTGSIWLKGEGSNIGKDVVLTVKRAGGTSADNSITHTLTADWVRVDATFTQLPDNTGAVITLVNQGVNVPSEVLAFGAQFEEGTTASDYIPTSGTISGAPRFDHDPATGESLGLLIEESRTNLLTYSEEFDNVSWTKSNSTITANTISAPNGEITADALIENTAASTHSTAKSVSVSSGTTYTFTVHAKANERSHIDLDVSGVVTTTCIVRFTLSGSGASALRQGSPTPTHSITALSNGWYRCQITITTTSAGSGVFQVTLAPDASSSPFYTGDGTSGVYIWGAQIEQGSFATSYIPTEGTTVTRAADVAEITGTNFSSWFTQNTGTVFVEASLQSPASAGQAPIVSVDNSGADFRAFSRRRNLGARNTSSTDSIEVTSAPWNGENKKIAVTWVPNDCALVDNGVLVGTDTSTNSPLTTVNQMRIGVAPGGGYLARMGGHIKRLAYFPTRLPDATLQNITS